MDISKARCAECERPMAVSRMVCPRCDDDLDLGAPLPQAPHQVRRLVGGDAARHAEYHPFSTKLSHLCVSQVGAGQLILCLGRCETADPREGTW